MEMKVAVVAHQETWMDAPAYTVFHEDVEEASLGGSFTMVDKNAVVTFKTLEEAELIKKQIASLERERARIDAEASRRKTVIEDRIAKLSALTWEKL